MLKKLNNEESKNCANCMDSAQKAFFREVEEDLQKEQLKKVWDKYGTLIVIVVVAALSFAAGFEGFKAWREELRQRDSIAYENAKILIEQQDFEAAIKVLDEIAVKAKTGYGITAAIEKATLLVEIGQKEDGILELEKVYQNSKTPKVFKDLVAIKMAGYLIDDGSKEKILALIEPLTYESSAWRSLALELKALLFLREGNKKFAVNYLNSIINDNSAHQRIRARAVEMVSVLEE